MDSNLLLDDSFRYTKTFNKTFIDALFMDSNLLLDDSFRFAQGLGFRV